jgi:aryl-alcohol dehydrogenase-like predicted oxidoreductase
MSGVDQSGTFALGDWQVRRLGFGAMHLLIAGTSSVAHLRENVTAATLRLADNALATLDELTRRRA